MKTPLLILLFLALLFIYCAIGGGNNDKEQ